MADLASVKVLALQLLDEVCLAQGAETVSAQLAAVAQLQADLATRTQERDTAIAERDAAVTALQPYKDFAVLAKADAQARKDADAAKVDGDDILAAAAGLP